MVNVKSVGRLVVIETGSLVTTSGPDVSTTAKGTLEYSAEIVMIASRELSQYIHSAPGRGTKLFTVASLRHEQRGCTRKVHLLTTKSYPQHYCIDKKNVILIS